MAWAFAWIVELTLIKLSILFFYSRIFTVSASRRALYVLFALTTAWGIGCVSI